MSCLIERLYTRQPSQNLITDLKIQQLNKIIQQLFSVLVATTEYFSKSFASIGDAFQKLTDLLSLFSCFWKALVGFGVLGLGASCTRSYLDQESPDGCFM